MALSAAQKRIGWSGFFKGFLTKQWQTYLEHECSLAQSPKSDKPLNMDCFFLGLIKTIWTEQTAFWLSHQDKLHSPPNDTTTSVAIQELHLEVRQLHTLRHKVPSQYHDTYFPRDVHRFLQLSTTQQLKTYIANYRPIILRSIAEDNKRQSKTKRLTEYPGFHPPSTKALATRRQHTHSDAPNPSFHQSTLMHTMSPQTAGPTFNPYCTRPRHTQSSSLYIPDITLPTPQLPRERFPRKHSKWKPSQTIQARFFDYFLPSRGAPTQTSNTLQPT